MCPGDSCNAAAAVDIEVMKKLSKNKKLAGKHWAFGGFPCGSAGKDSAYNAGDLDLVPELGRSLGEGKGYPLQCSALEDSMSPWSHNESGTTERLSRSAFNIWLHSL